MQYRSIVIAAEDFESEEIDTIAKIIEGYIGDLNLSCSGKMKSFRWRIDVSARFDDES